MTFLSDDPLLGTVEQRPAARYLTLKLLSYGEKKDLSILPSEIGMEWNFGPFMK